jgi:SAM-dependent MidA family methyltransferase
MEIEDAAALADRAREEPCERPHCRSIRAQSSNRKFVRKPAAVTPLAARLAERIRRRGPMPFAEYMDACLYHPQHGYYTKPNQLRGRDYFTNADVKPLFGRLLTRQLEEMWVFLGRPNPFWLVEAGAASGALAKVVLDFAARTSSDFYAALRYRAVEISQARREAQAALLDEHIRRGRFASAAELPCDIGVGCVFSNELLDALPVHRVVQERGNLREFYVANRGAGLCDQSAGLSSPRIAAYFDRQGIELREDQQAEAGLAACDWIREAGARLRRGFILTIDYGRDAGELYDECRMRGTLLAYKGHRASEEFFRAPGEQDLTAHVNFTALDLWGRESGLARTGLVSQTNFLLALARKSNLVDIDPEGATEREKSRLRLLFKTLINPEGMGETFQVLIQHKGVETPALTGLQPL